MDDDRESVFDRIVLVQIFLFRQWTKRRSLSGYSAAPFAVHRSGFARVAIEGIFIAVDFARL